MNLTNNKRLDREQPLLGFHNLGRGATPFLPSTRIAIQAHLLSQEKPRKIEAWVMPSSSLYLSRRHATSSFRLSSPATVGGSSGGSPYAF